MDGVGRQRFGRAHERGVDPHPACITSKHGDHRRIRKTARHLGRPQKATPLALNDRHPMKSDFAAGRRNAAHGAHERVDASRQAFANERTGITARLEPSDHARNAQAPQNVAEDHRGNDVAASGVEKYDAPQLGVGATRFEEIDKGLRRLSLDDAIGDDYIGTTSAAFAGLERRDMKTHRPTALLRSSWRKHNSLEHERDDQHRKRPKAPVAGGR